MQKLKVSYVMFYLAELKIFAKGEIHFFYIPANASSWVGTNENVKMLVHVERGIFDALFNMVKNSCSRTYTSYCISLD